MLKKLRNKIEEKRDSKNHFWKILVFGKDSAWKIGRHPLAYLKLKYLSMTDKIIKNIDFFETKTFSQNGEDGIIEAIFAQIGITNKFFVEFGVGNAIECNTRLLLKRKG